jgi:hypothetical protein
MQDVRFCKHFFDEDPHHPLVAIQILGKNWYFKNMPILQSESGHIITLQKRYSHKTGHKLCVNVTSVGDP